ncbi:MAG: DNA repair protein RadC [Bacteroidales bacterium]|nr:DNA repair protein RadC [Bacteroidales bacterium]
MNEDNANATRANLPINLWAEEDRPREKMLSQGKKSLTDSELIAILLRTGVTGTSAIDLAKQLLQLSNNSLTELSRMEINDLKKAHKGLGMAKAVTVLAALELGNRMMREAREVKEDIVHGSEDLFHYIGPTIWDLPNEEFWAIYLNQRNKVVRRLRIGSGGLTQTTVDLRIIFREALQYNAVAIAVAHNHPSGSLAPSSVDKDLTRRIEQAGKILSIKLVDHLIVGILPEGQPGYYSFTEHGLL